MTKQSLYIPALSGLYDRLTPFALPALRIGVAFVFFRHGWTKLFDAEGHYNLAGWISNFSASDTVSFIPGIVILSWLIILIETLGALLLALGLFVRPVALSMLVFMMTAVFLRFPADFSWPAGFSPVEKEFLLALVCSYFVVVGGGGYSIDSKLKKTF